MVTYTHCDTRHACTCGVARCVLTVEVIKYIKGIGAPPTLRSKVLECQIDGVSKSI